MMDSFDRLPRGFASAKPFRSIDLREAMLRDQRGDWIIQRKRDGEKAYLVIGSKPRIFSSGLEDLSAHVPHLVEQAKKLYTPYGTIFVGELVADREADNAKLVSSFCRSSPTRAALYDLKPGLAIFDLLFLNRVDAWRLPYEERYNAMRLLLPKTEREVRLTGTTHLWQERALDRPLTACRELAHDNEWEGLVLWDKLKATSIKSGVSVKEADRVGCYKMKEYRDAEFVATGFEPGEKSIKGQMGALHISQYVKQGYQLVLQACGKVGTGFSQQERVEAVKWTYPLSVQVRYDSQEPTGGLRCPSFMRLRPDVPPDYCIRDAESTETTRLDDEAWT